jgi:hypothetical protein
MASAVDILTRTMSQAGEAASLGEDASGICLLGDVEGGLMAGDFTFPPSDSTSSKHYYHTTPKPNLPGIAREGLKTSGTGGLSIASDIDTAKFWAETLGKEDMVLLRMPRSSVPTRSLFEPNFTKETATSKTIKSSKLKVFKNGKWRKL